MREVGRGAFGVVYQAEQVYPGTQVAIKVLLDAAPEEREALLEEARKIAAWHHPHITLVLGFSEYQGFPYLVLQYAPYGTLKDRYPPGRAFPFDAILSHVHQIAEGLQYAHERQTLHLDLKPANVLLDEQQRALISDFGISVILQPNKTHLTVRKFMGTPAYAAPEQFDEERGQATPASDQYALATMVYQWLTGRLPFEGGSFMALATQKVLKDPQPLGTGAPPAVEQVVMKALAKDPRARFPSVRAFAEALLAAKNAVATNPQAPIPYPQPPMSYPQAPTPPSTPPVGAQMLLLREHTGAVYAVAWSPDGRHLASADEGAVRLWDAEHGQSLATFSGYSNRVLAVVWSPDGRRIASASADQTVRLWDVERGLPLTTFTGHTGVVNGITWSPDGRRLASASWDKTIRLWDATNGHVLAMLSGHTDWVSSVSWSPDGRCLASASEDETVRLWDATNGQPLAVLSGHTDAVTAVAWSPDGRHLASASEDHTACLWDPQRNMRLPLGHTSIVYAVAWSPDSRRLATADADRTVRLWDTTQGLHLATLSGHTDRVRAVAWSPDSRRLASAGNDQTVRVWWMG